MPTIEPYYSKKMTCPLCDTEFTTSRVRSRAAIPSVIDSDFCAHYKEKNVNPNYYAVNVCPECGYAYTEEFSPNFPAGTKGILEKKVSQNWEKRAYDGERDGMKAMATFKLAILSATLKKEKHVVMGNLCLRLAWIYRIEEETDQEERFLRLAVEEFEKSYLDSDFTATSMSELRMLYMIGELNRRLKDYQKAITYFSKIVEHPKKSTEMKTVNMAREQWSLAMEEYRKLQGQNQEEQDS